MQCSRGESPDFLQKIACLPETRADVVDRARVLVNRNDYPPAEVMRQIALLLTTGIR